MNPVTLENAKEANAVVDWTNWSAHENCEHIPNAETIAAFEEAEQIIRDIKAGVRKPYNNFAEILAEIETEIEAEKSVQS